MSRRLRLVYFGSGAFGLPTLRRLAREHDILLVVTQPDRPAGRGRDLAPTAVSTLASELGLAVIKPPKADDPQAIRQIREVAADAFVVIAYGHKLRPALLGDTFAINLHASLLPKYRGAAPINWAMISGEERTGVSVIELSQTIDAGDVLESRSTAIDPMETAGELHDRLTLLGPEVMVEVLAAWSERRLRRVKQDDRLACAAPKLTKAEGTVRFDQPAARVRQRVHGLTPWPGCTVLAAGGPLRLARVAEQPPAHVAQVDTPGAVLDDGMVACRPGLLRLLDVQAPGGRVMTFAEYARGHSIPSGTRLEPVA